MYVLIYLHIPVYALYVYISFVILPFFDFIIYCAHFCLFFLFSFFVLLLFFMFFSRIAIQQCLPPDFRLCTDDIPLGIRLYV